MPALPIRPVVLGLLKLPLLAPFITVMTAPIGRFNIYAGHCDSYIGSSRSGDRKASGTDSYAKGE